MRASKVALVNDGARRSPLASMTLCPTVTAQVAIAIAWRGTAVVDSPKPEESPPPAAAAASAPLVAEIGPVPKPRVDPTMDYLFKKSRDGEKKPDR
jgi:hypothetical protein